MVVGRNRERALAHGAHSGTLTSLFDDVSHALYVSEAHVSGRARRSEVTARQTVEDFADWGEQSVYNLRNMLEYYEFPVE